ncbi:DUF4397 domain-containing protein [Hathewaya histolytica]|uniref:DUF4397 domain-containing protein n=1 Tax=Hathewaya histolytica TaxID=1498 RepID=A0A4U9RRR5_HATHI|nr:DUF4397 domain-containing protein [Hathewaya histolytica]VTQ93563.1 Uncharacterised protein [Hathewaya histolytica]
MNNEIPSYLKSFIRVLHASPKTPSVDVYINNIPVIRNLQYRGFTEYLPLPAGNYNVKIYPASNKNVLLLDQSLTIAPNKILTIAGIGKGPESLALLPILDPKITPDNRKSYLRFAHLSPNTPPLDIVTTKGKTLFKNVSYRQLQGYVELPPGVYDVDVRLSGTTTSVLYVPNIALRPNNFYTIYAVGLLNDEPPLQVLIPLDGNSYINFYS